ncbi:MAG TPA: DUF6607 family protein [Steroidobacteraceae bacterium]|nr:DUF6607 family protein [Steroidobacteraceae bacterium]
MISCIRGRAPGATLRSALGITLRGALGITLRGALGIALTTLAALGCGSARADAPPPRYTFTWQLGQPDSPAPRGGTTKGPPVTLETEPSKAWTALREPGLSPFERDRRAILAMAGDYRVTFDFLEIETFPTATPRDKPYQSWGTERIYVDSDSGKTISLVHILDMRVVQADGSISEPMVTKHWRQTWQYEPADLVEFKGRERWERRALSPAESTGTWSQTVYQVDESPRYASLGHWSHTASFSTWISGDTWRPLPRREWSVRKDYQVLLGTNRHTITATGWVQEENNLKTVLTQDRAIDSTKPYLAREYGVARYSHIRGGDFAAADEYYQKTRAFWDGVLGTWHQLFVGHPQITLRAPVDQAGLFHKLFEYADQLAAGGRPAVKPDEVIRQSLYEMGAPVPAQARRSVTDSALR